MKFNTNNNIKYSLALNGIYDPQLFGMSSFIELVMSRYPENKSFFPTVFAYLKKRGFSGMEFSFGPGSRQNVLDTFGSFKEFGKVLEGEGLELSSVFCTDMIFARPTVADVMEQWKTREKQDKVKDELKETASMAAETGCRYIPINPPIRKQSTGREDEEIMTELYNEFGRVIKSEGAELLIHNESNSIVWSHEDINCFLEHSDPESIGLCPDIAHIRDCGGKPEELLREHADKIKIMHWKDCAKEIPKDFAITPDLFERHNSYYAALGRGLIDFKACADAVKEKEWKGWIVLEIPVGKGTKNIDESIELLNQYM